MPWSKPAKHFCQQQWVCKQTPPANPTALGLQTNHLYSSQGHDTKSVLQFIPEVDGDEGLQLMSPSALIPALASFRQGSPNPGQTLHPNMLLTPTPSYKRVPITLSEIGQPPYFEGVLK